MGEPFVERGGPHSVRRGSVNSTLIPARGAQRADSRSGEEAKAMYRALTESSVKCNSETPNPCADAEGTLDRARVLTAVGVAGFAVSLVGGALVVYEFVQSGPQRRKASARLVVDPAPGGGALKVTGRF